MTRPQVDLIWNDQVEDLTNPRVLLRSSLESADCSPYWNEWRIGSQNYPARLRFFREPGVVVNGKLIVKLSNRLTKEELTENIIKYRSRKSISIMGWVVNMAQSFVMLALVLFPKCPICWMVYANVFAQLGIHIPYLPQLSYLFMGLSLTFAAYLFSRRKTTGIVSPILMLMALGLITLNKYGYQDRWILSVGAMVLSVSAALMVVVPAARRLQLIPKR